MNLLIIDDDLTFLSLSKSILQKEGHKIFCCPDISEAEKIISKEEIHLILLDYYLCNENSFSFLKEMRRVHPPTELAIIIITNSDDHELIIKTLRAGANDYILKPINTQILKARINNQLNFLNLYKDSIKSKEMETLNQFVIGSNKKIKSKLSETIKNFEKMKGKGVTEEGLKSFKKNLLEISHAISNIGEHARNESIPYNFSNTNND